MSGASEETRRLGAGLAFCSPWIIGFCAFTALPVGLSLYYSFFDYTLLREPVFCGLENYRELLRDQVFHLSLWNTAKYAMLALPAGMLVSLGLALMLNAPIRGQSIYRTIIFLPSLVPLVASAMLWLWLFNAKVGLINYALGLLGIDGPNWLANPAWTIPALVLMSFWGVGHTVVIYLAGLQDVPRELYEAAEIDGATGIRRLWHVTLPMISPVIFFNLIMGIIGVWQVFAVPQIMFPGGGIKRSALFYSMQVYDSAFLHLRMGYASAMAWIQLLIIVAMTALAFWSSRKWVHYQGR